MGRLKFALGILLGVVLENRTARIFVTGIVALLALFLGVGLVCAFPAFFGALVGLAILGFAVYYVGYVIWEIIES